MLYTMSGSTSTAMLLPAQPSSMPTTSTAAPTKGSNKLYDVPTLKKTAAILPSGSFRVELVLQIWNLWPLIDGSNKAPTNTTSPDYTNWIYQDCEVHVQIALTLTDKPLNTVFQA